jgi:hypothetical protein
MSADIVFTPDALAWIELNGGASTIDSMLRQAVTAGNVGFVRSMVEAPGLVVGGSSRLDRAGSVLRWLSSSEARERDLARRWMSCLGYSPDDVANVASAATLALYQLCRSDMPSVDSELHRVRRLLELGADPAATSGLGIEFLGEDKSPVSIWQLVMLREEDIEPDAMESLRAEFARMNPFDVPRVGGDSIIQRLNDDGSRSGSFGSAISRRLRPVCEALDAQAPLVVEEISAVSKAIRGVGTGFGFKRLQAQLHWLAPMAYGLGRDDQLIEFWLGPCLHVLPCGYSASHSESRQMTREIDPFESDQPQAAPLAIGFLYGLQTACEADVEVMRLFFARLKAAGVDLDAPAGCGLKTFSPIHVAVSFGHPGVVDALLRAGVSLETPTPAGQTVLSLVEGHPDRAMEAVLVRHHASRLREMLAQGPLGRAVAGRARAHGGLA